MTKAKHGTRSRYVLGCRCDDCSQANRDYMREWRRNDYARNPRKYNDRQWRSRVPGKRSA